MKFSIALFLFCQASLVMAGSFTGEVFGITDGDTVKVLKADNSQVKIRLRGIDAPESKQAYGTKSKQALSKLLFGKTVIVKDHGKGRLGCTLGTIYLDKLNINEKMVQGGWAWHCSQYSTDKGLAEAENAARKAKIGLWQGESPIAPWEWRKTNRIPVQSTAKTSTNRTPEKVAAKAYGKAIWGMSEQEVLAVEEGRIGKLKKPRKYKGSTGMLRIENLEIAHKNCYAEFLFDNSTKKLRQVNIKFPKKADNTASLFSSLEELLSQKYGAPIFKSKNHTVSWLNRGTKITLKFLYISGIVSDITVAYEPAEEGISDL